MTARYSVVARPTPRLASFRIIARPEARNSSASANWTAPVLGARWGAIVADMRPHGAR